MNVEDLPQRIGHKAGDGDARDEEIKGAQRGKALPFAHVEQRGDAVRDGQRRDHHRENDASRQRAQKSAPSGRWRENKRKTKRARVVWKPKMEIGS